MYVAYWDELLCLVAFDENDICDGNVHGEYHTLAVCLKAVHRECQRDVQNLSVYIGG